MGFNVKEHIGQLKGKDYLEVKWRLVWFREDHPNGSILTDLVNIAPPVVKATISDEQGRIIATGLASAKLPQNGNAVWAGREIEKAETAAIGRALAHAGYGTQFAGEDVEEGDNLADSPVERKPSAPTQPERPARPANVTQMPQPAERAQGEAPASNGHAPRSLEQITAYLVNLVPTMKGATSGTISQGQAANLAQAMQDLMDKETRLFLLNRLFGVTTSKDLNERQFFAIKEWLKTDPQQLEAEIKNVIAARKVLAAAAPQAAGEGK